jgi:hypothetical protein
MNRIPQGRCLWRIAEGQFPVAHGACRRRVGYRSLVIGYSAKPLEVNTNNTELL